MDESEKQKMSDEIAKIKKRLDDSFSLAIETFDSDKATTAEKIAKIIDASFNMTAFLFANKIAKEKLKCADDIDHIFYK